MKSGIAATLRAAASAAAVLLLAATAALGQTRADPHDPSATIPVDCVDCHALHGGFVIPRNGDQETMCLGCHNPTGKASSLTNNFALHTKKADGSVVADCGSCHEPHGAMTASGESTANRWLIRADPNKYVSGALSTLVFTTDNVYTKSSSPYNGMCQACHTTAKHYKNSAGDTHNSGADCLSCHDHGDGFEPAGCTSCHASPQDKGDGAPTRRAVVAEFSKSSRHVQTTLEDAHCAVCHAEAGTASLHQNNQVDLLDPDTGTALTGFTSFTRDRTTATLESWATNVQDNFCLKCHDGGSSGGATSTKHPSGSATNPFNDGKSPADINAAVATTNTFEHAIKQAGSNPYTTSTTTNGSKTTMVTPWNQSGNHDKITCFDCHGDYGGTGNSLSGHGWTNQRGLRDSIDFATMEGTSTPPSGMGATVEAFCTRCHSSSIYVTGVTGGGGSVYEYHGGNQSQHSASGGNQLGCMGCHGGVRDESGLSNGNGASTLNIHGGSFTWPSASFASGTATDHFMLGGWISGWRTTTNRGSPIGECRGGNCNHANSSKTYTR